MESDINIFNHLNKQSNRLIFYLYRVLPKTFDDASKKVCFFFIWVVDSPLDGKLFAQTCISCPGKTTEENVGIMERDPTLQGLRWT